VFSLPFPLLFRLAPGDKRACAQKAAFLETRGGISKESVFSRLKFHLSLSFTFVPVIWVYNALILYFLVLIQK
jgi:hypothetical protein